MLRIMSYRVLIVKVLFFILDNLLQLYFGSHISITTVQGC